MALRRLLGLLLVGLSACPKTESPPDAAAPAGAISIDASTPAAVDLVDSGSVADGGTAEDAGLLELPLTFAIETDAGVQALEFVNGAAEIDPAQTFVIDSRLGLKDVRVRLIDWADQVVASDDSISLDGGFSYRLSLQQPAKPGRTYTLLIDAEIGPLLTDSTGHTWDDVRRTLTVRGEVQPEPGRPTKKKPHKR